MFTVANSKYRRSSEKKQYAWFVAVFLYTATPWYVGAWEDSSMPGSSDIIMEAKKPERERRRERRTRQITWGCR